MRVFRIPIIFIMLLIFFLPFALQARHFARWWTTLGSFTSDLRDEIVPITANNFIDLTNAGFYNGLHFHRVISGFMIQDGCPQGPGYGGPGYTIQDEFSPLLLHDSAGVLAMARTSQPNSAGSQYYITLAPTSWLDGGYAVFGKVFQGLDVVMNIGSVQTDANDHPISNVNIDSLKILNMVINSVSPATDSVVVFDSASPFPFVVEAYGLYTNVQFAWYIDDVLQPQFTDIIMEPVFTSNGLHIVKCVNTDADLTWTTTWQVDVSSVGNNDQTMVQTDLRIITLYPNPFREKTSLVFSTKANQPVRVSIYDTKGRMVKSELLNSKAGINQWNWNGRNASDKALPAGMYLIRLSSEGAQSVQKAVHLR
jgi:peptidyl-prolyl cis-trans isomerase B (cyclophilin B)